MKDEELIATALGEKEIPATCPINHRDECVSIMQQLAVRLRETLARNADLSQMRDRERAHWLEERERRDEAVNQIRRMDESLTALAQMAGGISVMADGLKDALRASRKENTDVPF